MLGTDEYLPKDSKFYYGTFRDSALEHIELPSTLRRIEYSAFQSCKNLQRIHLPEKLEYIGQGCFFKSGLQSIAVPPTTKVLDKCAFY